MGIDFYINWADLILIYAIYAISLNLLMGYAGQVSVAHAAFGAVGGYGAGYMSVHYATPFPAAVAIGVGAALVIGALVSLPALQLSSEYLILLTLAVATIIIIVLTSSQTFGGLYGLLDIKQASLFGFAIVTPQDFLWLLLSLTALVFALCWWLGESPFGRVLRGIRDDEIATRALGKNIVAYKVIVFATTSAMAGLAGAMLVYYNSLASPGQFNFDQSMAIIAMVILGGLGNFFGSLVGAFLIVASEPFLEHVVKINVEKAPLVRLLAYGLALVVILGLRPRGLVPEGVSPLASLRRLARRRPDRGAARLPAATEAADAIPIPLAVRGPNDEVLVGVQSAAGEAVATLAPPAVRRDPAPAANGCVAVDVRDLTKHFGGIRAVDGLDLELGAARITGLIGPNGAGKTTVFNLLTGAIRPDRGTVVLNERAITGMPPNRVVKEGMARSYQDVRIYPRLSVLDNVMLGVQHQPGEDVVQAVFMPWRALRGERETRQAALHHLEFVGMAGRARERAGALGFGEQKLVALARLLATEAEVLLLDEPASGIDQIWVERMLELIIRLRDRGRTICIVEHNLHIVERLADQIYFMEQGRITAAGTMQDLTSQERLLEAYFGTT
jgi:branched-chain amino acid transport system permease protein